MRRSISVQVLLTLVIGLGLFASPVLAIEAVRGKTYQLSKQHGPWMIMVASFRNVPSDRRQEGLSAEQAAMELVYELREKGIPAYSFSQDAVVEKIETKDRQGREDERIFAAQRDMVCVLAGNYDAIDDDTAQKTLQYVKRFRPKFFQAEKSGAIFAETPGQKGPLGGAFMTINPLLKPEEILARKSDPDMLRLNAGSMFPLLSNKKKFTVQVATFVGKQTTPIGSSAFAGNESKFDSAISKAKNDPTAYDLNRAGEDAEQLAKALREKNVEAYVHHDRYQSIVTVGGFDTPNDPKAYRIIQEYCAKMKPENPEKPNDSRLVLSAEAMAIKIPATRNAPETTQGILFDPQPRVIAVPKKK